MDIQSKIRELRANAETLRGIGMIDSANLMDEAADTMEALNKVYLAAKGVFSIDGQGGLADLKRAIEELEGRG